MIPKPQTCSGDVDSLPLEPLWVLESDGITHGQAWLLAPCSDSGETGRQRPGQCSAVPCGCVLKYMYPVFRCFYSGFDLLLVHGALSQPSLPFTLHECSQAPAPCESALPAGPAVPGWPGEPATCWLRVQSFSSDFPGEGHRKVKPPPGKPQQHVGRSADRPIEPIHGLFSLAVIVSGRQLSGVCGLRVRNSIKTGMRPGAVSSPQPPA